MCNGVWSRPSVNVCTRPGRHHTHDMPTRQSKQRVAPASMWAFTVVRTMRNEPNLASTAPTVARHSLVRNALDH